jgi:O-antigen ligase
VAFLLPVVFSPSVAATFWTPAAALCLVVAAVGVPRLVALARVDRWAVVAASVFLVSSLASALVSHNPRIGILGLYYWGTGWLFIATLVGAWAIGRSLAGDARNLVASAVIAAALVNSVVALLETAVGLDAFHLGQVDGRSPGLLGNPIHLGTFSAATVALVAPRFERAPWRWAAGVAALGAAVQASGSRFGIIAGVGVVIALGFRYPKRTVAAVAGLLIVGGLFAGVLASVGDGGAIASDRVAAGSAGGGFRPRLETWRTGLEAVADRPVLGWGPGEFRTATSPRRTLALARTEGPDKLFVDAHNIVVEYAVTTGLVGIAALLTWLVLATRDAGGPLLVFALAELANHLVQPQAVRTTPVAFLALGLAAPRVPQLARRLGASVQGITGIAVASALAAGGWLLVGDFHLEQARLDFADTHAKSAAAMLPYPESARVRGRVFLFNGRIQRSDQLTREGVAWFGRAVRRDDRDPPGWIAYAYELIGIERSHDAEKAFQRALALNPMSTAAREGLAVLALQRGDHAGARRWARSALAIEPDVTARSLLRRAVGR